MAGEASEASEPWQELGTDLVVDQPGVKCWIERVPAHSSRPVHTHRHPWVTVVLAGAAGESRAPDGELIDAGAARIGDVRFHGPECLPFSHYLVNTSDDALVMVAVELRDADLEPVPTGKANTTTGEANR